MTQQMTQDEALCRLLAAARTAADLIKQSPERHHIPTERADLNREKWIGVCLGGDFATAYVSLKEALAHYGIYV